MKFLILLLTSLFTLQVSAASWGKFQVNLIDGLSGVESKAEFLMNSKGEITVLDSDYLLNPEASLFFGETTIEFQSWGDEDYALGMLTLEGNKITDICTAVVDNKNEMVAPGDAKLVLKRWSKSKKKYVELKSLKQSDECKERLKDRYDGYEVF